MMALTVEQNGYWKPLLGPKGLSTAEPRETLNEYRNHTQIEGLRLKSLPPIPPHVYESATGPPSCFPPVSSTPSEYLPYRVGATRP